MKLSDTTIETLKNFSDINTSLVIQPGKVQRTMKNEMEILGEATFEDDFPVQAGIYELPQFLGLVKMMDNPNIVWNDTHAILNDGTFDTTYVYSNIDLISSPPSDPIEEITDPDAKVVVLESQLSKMKKIASALDLPHLFLIGDEKGVHLKIDDKDNKDSHKSKVTLSNDPVKEFSTYWLIEHLLLVPGNYNLTVSLDRQFSFWENENQTRKYFVALQAE